MKIFLTGASGLVGGAFAYAAAQEGHEVIGTVGAFRGQIGGLNQTLVLDLANAEQVKAAVSSSSPEVIVNAAGVSEPAKCDANPSRSHCLNVLLPALLAEVARERGARLIHVSSEQVFDGTHAPYAHTDAVSPINLYGQQKLESERRVHATAPAQAVTLRAPLLMGNSPGGRRSLHERLLADWSAGKTARVYADEFRQTCTAENLASAMLELCARGDVRGVFHWAGSELLSRVQLAERLRAHFNFSETRTPISAIYRTDHPEAASQRQPNLALRLEPLSLLLATPVQAFSEQLAQLRIPAELRDWAARAVLR